MDPHSFDAIARSLAAPKTRRGLLGALAALGTGIIGSRAANAQVTQSQCGNVVCGSNPGVCNAGCVCCAYSNGNSRCVPPSKCTGSGTVATTTTTSTTTAPTTTTTSEPTTTTTTTPRPLGTCAGMADGDPCGTGGACLDERCFLAVPNCQGSTGVAANSGGVNACVCSFDGGADCDTTSDCPAGQWCLVTGASAVCFGGCLV